MPVLCNWVMGTPSQRYPQGGCRRQLLQVMRISQIPSWIPFGHLITRHLGVIRVILTSRKTLYGAASGLWTHNAPGRVAGTPPKGGYSLDGWVMAQELRP